MTRALTLTVLLLAAMTIFAQAPDAQPPAPADKPSQTGAPVPAEAKPQPDSAHFVVKKRFPAIYSKDAEEKKLHGTVVLSVLFNETGHVENAEATSGDPTLAQCALDSIKHWTIEPFIRGGKPVKVKVSLPIEFVYDDAAADFITGEIPAQTAGAEVDRVSLAGPNMLQRRIVSKIAPQYPAAAKAAHVSGSVTFAATIGKDGAIEELSIVGEADPLLEQAAGQAVRQWRYQPYIYHGSPVAFDTRILVNFMSAP